MELIDGNVKKLYFRYLAAAFGSALVGAVYTLVDMAVIGQYAGPDGTAAIALVLPACGGNHRDDFYDCIYVEIYEETGLNQQTVCFKKPAA